ncbi:uncharacterized protein RBU47_015899 [Passerculus sandwichensis]
MPRRSPWTQAEVDGLLSLVEDSGEAALLMASTSRPNEALWREVCQGLAAAGYERTVAQCRTKWKALKQAFHSERQRRRRAGVLSALLPRHYRAMKSIWKAAGQPVFGKRRMSVVMRLPSRRCRSALGTRSPSSPEPPEHGAGGDTPSMLLSPMLQRAKNEPESPAGGEHVAGVPPTAPAMPRFPGEMSLGMGRGNRVLPLAAAATGSHRTAATRSEVTGLLQHVHQLLVEILYTSQQQRALLEDLVQVGETMHQLVLQPQTHPGPLGHVPLFKGGSGVPCHPGAPHTSWDHKEKP